MGWTECKECDGQGHDTEYECPVWDCKMCGGEKRIWSVDAPEGVSTEYYIRFGGLPAGDERGVMRSYNSLDRKKEAGVSVWYAKQVDGKWTAVGRSTMFFAGRKAYLVTGEKIGNGSDDEPILRNVKIIKEV